ncbi:XRE family transcriptional regulator [Fructilactobacillus vespulae]|uniref:helix-turn-helix domain-containing protein n=1 Tax=Fructilactobacillus vespulae TaxID=1249630 RepID=UPI0039B4369D
MEKIDPLTFGSNIKQIRKSKSYSLRQVSNQSTDEKGINISPSYWSLVERGERNIPKIKTLQRIAKALRVPEKDIFELAGLGRKEDDASDNSILKDFTEVPVINKITERNNILAKENIIRYIKVPSSLANGNNFFIMEYQRDSMEPTIKKGSRVLIKMQDSANNGKIAAILLQDNTIILKKVKKTDQDTILIPDNPNYSPLILNQDKLGKIIGIVKLTMKEF